MTISSIIHPGDALDPPGRRPYDPVEPDAPRSDAGLDASGHDHSGRRGGDDLRREVR